MGHPKLQEAQFPIGDNKQKKEMPDKFSGPGRLRGGLGAVGVEGAGELLGDGRGG